MIEMYPKMIEMYPKIKQKFQKGLSGKCVKNEQKLY